MSIEQIEVGVPISGVLTLRDGTCVPVREIRAEDAAALQRLVGRSSERSIELRFLGPMKELSEEKARRFAEVDGVDRFALVALDPEDEDEIVAVVRYEREGGIGRLHALVLRENRRMLGLLRSLEFPERRRWENDLEHIEIDLRSGRA